MDCYYCKANAKCSAGVMPGSVMCMVNRLHYGGTHADEMPQRQKGDFCMYCGQHLRQIGSERFCNNPSCRNRYEKV